MVGAFSGALWFGLAIAFDKGVQDFNYPVIPTDSSVALFMSSLCGIATGVAVALLFQRPLLSRSWAVFFGLPLATLPAALIVFSLLVWVTWLGFGSLEEPPFLRLGNILGIFLIYGLLSIFAPVLYAFALLNQYLLRSLVQRT
ncbi:MAG TPA: hypothetical protein VFE68_18795 [Vicinamibacteria bacterium]|nr:hypothetical protein [Vicinamibacteria bacterium]